MIEYLICTSIVLGTFFILVSAIGLLRLPDVYSRMHAVTKATTLGMAGVLAGSALFFGASGRGYAGEILTIGFIFLTNPVGGHMIGRSAYLIGIPLWEDTVVDQLERAGELGNVKHDQA